MTQLSRRGFFGLAASATAGLIASASLDPERLLWVPGERTLFLPPERTLVQARTLQEALSKGLTAVFPDGRRMVVVVGEMPYPFMGTIAEIVQREIQSIEAMGGRVLKVEDLKPGWNWGQRHGGYSKEESC